MLHLMETVFKDKVATPEWQTKLKQIIPSYGTQLNGNVEATEKELGYTSRVLQLDNPTPAAQPAEQAPAAEAAPAPQGNTEKKEQKQPADIAL
ncbi:Malate:quinone oxidoreductase [Ewingella americana]|uniref:malate dehydrogenase (quinone) n=3 Tax=Ewingella americana TaxID=41202 RepID=A0A377N603_9GAMM|nr:Malate:quinone oxidoreductase [Ewingella americana]